MKIRVGEGKSIQDALDKAKAGDQLVLSPGAIGRVTLPPGANWIGNIIYIREISDIHGEGTFDPKSGEFTIGEVPS